MFLKSLEIRGFKSFADRTVLEFAPGISVIVGPNGSGKSNLVDAIAWVLGEQGARTLRGGKMEDVIFAGTPGRPASGRAEVSLTIDNAQRILPIDFTEVTIRRTLFRSGESEYAINGVPCRLLDVQELLSDTGVGRELHTIVGQGQLDEVLDARPEERRAYIEEAAGVLKHRRRRERALRKLERVDADIERLGDVIAELRRQIRPLERQAEIARRAAEIEAELADVRLAVWAAEYRAVLGEVDAEAERRLVEEVEALSAEAAELGARAEELEGSAATAARAAERALGAEGRLARVRERLAGLARLAEERGRHLEDLAARAPGGQAPSGEALEAARRALAEATEVREEAEREAERAAEAAARARAAREEATRTREEVVHLHGERGALLAAVRAAEEERVRIAEQERALAEAARARASEIARCKDEIERLDERETALSRRLADLEARARERAARAERAAERVRELEREVERLEARRGALRAEVDRLGGAGGVDLVRERFPGIVGRVADLVRAVPGMERALAAALEPVAAALLARSPEDVGVALAALRRAGSRGAFLVAERVRRGELPAGTRSALEAARPAQPGVAIPAPLRDLLGSVALVDDLAEALALASAHPSLVVVTRAGDRVAGPLVVGGAPRAGDVDLPGELLALEERLAAIESALEDAARESWSARALADASAAEVAAVEGQINELDAMITGAAERLARLEREEHAADRERAVLAGRARELDERLAAERERLGSVEARLSRAAAPPAEAEAAGLADAERDAAEAALRLGSARERERAARAHLEELERRAREVLEARRAWERSREAWERGARRARALAQAAREAEARADAWLAELRAERESAEAERARLEEELAVARRARRDVEARLAEAREAAHRSDLARAERSHRAAALVERLRAEHGLTPEEAMARVGEPPAGEALEELRRRWTALERRLGLLGRASPIALEQYQSLVDRHAFLVRQVGDLRRSRRDLMAVVEEVDRKIEEIFAAAFADVAREFQEVFARLFPGGEGRLSLTDPSDLSASGVHVEARPGGKRVRRISLLSGGERALTAVALLFAIFRARPSPFYLLDEVEAALDDINLHRFLDLAREFKGSSQILIVTHQKRTMEIADALYGISMGPDGVSRVICERLDAGAPIGA